jgi:hypothetical protein
VRTSTGFKQVWFVTPREFAAEWNVSERTVLRWIEEGLPAYEFGDEVWTVTMIPRRRGNRWVLEYKV